jgi:hypothetical protein
MKAKKIYFLFHVVAMEDYPKDTIKVFKDMFEAEIWFLKAGYTGKTTDFSKASYYRIGYHETTTANRIYEGGI